MKIMLIMKSFFQAVCNFAHSTYVTRPGSCPRSVFTLESKQTPSCQNECLNDQMCHIGFKCCSKAGYSTSGCLTCQEASNHRFEYPPLVSSSLKVTEVPHTNMFELSWESWKTVGRIGKVIFVVRQRNVTGFYPYFGMGQEHWHVVKITDTKQMTIPTKPGWWSEFQVATVNKFGTKGFLKSSVCSRLSADPKPPKPPSRVITAVTQVETNVIRVNNVTWNEPEQSDLPITSYSVSFSCKPGSDELSEPIRISQTVCHSQKCFLNVTKNNIFECSQIRFFVTVTAHCDNWGSLYLNSSKVSRDLDIDQTSNFRVFEEGVLNDAGLGSLTIKEEFGTFSPDHVTVSVRWAAPFGKETLSYSLERVRGYCVTAGSDWISNLDGGSRVVLSESRNQNLVYIDLQYECEYALQIRGIDARNNRDTYTKRYFTPTCEATAIASRVDTRLCKHAEQSLSNIPFAAGKLTNLDFFFIGKNASSLTVNAVVSWNFDDAHYDIVTNEWRKHQYMPAIEIVVYKLLDKIGIINRDQSCSIYLNGQKDPNTGVTLLPNRLNLMDSKLARPCLLHYPKKYRLIARIVYSVQPSQYSSENEIGGRWSSVLLDTSVISFFDIFPPWKQKFYRDMDITTYLDAMEYEKKKPPEKVSHSLLPPISPDFHYVGGYKDYYEETPARNPLRIGAYVEINYISVRDSSILLRANQISVLIVFLYKFL